MSLWSEWRKNHPGAQVLAYPQDSSEYEDKRYESYAANDRLLFPVSQQDARLHVKKVIYGVEIDDQSIAVESEWLTDHSVFEHEVGGQTLKLVFNSSGAVVGTLNGQPVAVHRMYWFAWYSFHPGTSLIH